MSKISTKKVLGLLGIIVATTVSTVVSSIMQEGEIKKAVKEENDNQKKWEA